MSDLIHFWAELRGRSKGRETQVQAHAIVAGYSDESGGLYRPSIAEVVAHVPVPEYGYISHLRDSGGMVYDYLIDKTQDGVEFHCSATHADGSRVREFRTLNAKNWKQAFAEVLMLIPELAEMVSRAQAYTKAQKLIIKARKIEMEYNLR